MKRPDDLAPIAEAYLGGEPSPAIAERYGVSPGTVLDWLRKAGVEIQRRGRRKIPRQPKPTQEARFLQKNLDRVSEMARMYRDGKTLREIGDCYALTRERVRQLLARVGITSKDGGASIAAERKRNLYRIQRKRAHIERFGMLPGERKALIKKGATGAYARQRSAAAQRGIEWKFTLATWWRVWEESGKWDQRGRGDGFVMARFNDEGPYSPDNVKIVHSVENILEYYEREKGLDCSDTRARWNLPESLSGEVSQ